MTRPTVTGIVGAGAVGSLWAGRLLKASQRGFFLGRDGSRFTVGRQVVLSSVAYDLQAFADTGSPDVLVVCVKAYDLAAALAMIGESSYKPCPIILQGNGFIDRVVGEFLRTFPHWEVRFGLCTFGVKENEAGFVVVGDGVCEFGPAPLGLRLTQQPTTAEQALIANTGAIWNSDIVSAVRVKWLWNTVLNSLTAVYDLPTNGDAGTRKAEARVAFSESVAALKHLDPTCQLEPEQVWQDLWGLVDRTRANENSMHRDVRLRRRTESEFLAGAAGPNFPILSDWHLKIMSLASKM